MVSLAFEKTNERPMCSIKNISKTIDTTMIYKEFSLEIPYKSLYAIIGLNGSGKTTLIRLIAEVLKLDEGEIVTEGSISVMLDSNFLYENKTLKENIDYFGELFCIEHTNDKTYNYIQLLKLEDKLNSLVNTFSNGMKRKASLLITLLRDTEFILLDEPTLGVDIESKRHIRNILQELKEQGKTILLTSHDLDEVSKISDKVILLKKGGEKIEISDSENLEEYFS